MSVSDPAGNIPIRGSRAGDARAIEEIVRKSPEAAQWDTANYGRTSSAGQAILVAECGGVVCGFVVFRVAGGECEILNLAVDPAERRRGIATALLQAALAQARENKAEEAFLEVRESNVAAISFYRKLGFTKIGERARYYRGPTENAVLLKLKLTDQD